MPNDPMCSGSIADHPAPGVEITLHLANFQAIPAHLFAQDLFARQLTSVEKLHFVVDIVSSSVPDSKLMVLPMNLYAMPVFAVCSQKAACSHTAHSIDDAPP